MKPQLRYHRSQRTHSTENKKNRNQIYEIFSFKSALSRVSMKCWEFLKPVCIHLSLSIQTLCCEGSWFVHVSVFPNVVPRPLFPLITQFMQIFTSRHCAYTIHGVQPDPVNVGPVNACFYVVYSVFTVCLYSVYSLRL